MERGALANPTRKVCIYFILIAVCIISSAVRTKGESKAEEEEHENSIRLSLNLIHSFLIFFLQVGFVALETGSGRAKNVQNILLKNLLDVMICALTWWAVGFAFAYGDSKEGILGSNMFFFEVSSPPERPWIFTWTFAVACVTLVSGCLAERTHIIAYPVYTFVISAVVHPLYVHWVWNSEGWLRNLTSCQVLDFAGGSAVHMIGGMFGLIGALFVGPRLGRFDGTTAKVFPGHDMAFVSLGTFILWFGWYGFNCGSVYMYNTLDGLVSRRVAVSVTLSASASGLVALLVDFWATSNYDLVVACNGVLSGLVVVTPISGTVLPWAAFISGVLAGLFYTLNARLLTWLKIDDPLDSAAVHLGSGLLGMVMAGFLAVPEMVTELTGTKCGGAFYGKSGGLQLGMQVLGVVVNLVWSSSWALVVFYLLKRLGKLRVDYTTELAGIDNMEHGGPAYPEFHLSADREACVEMQPS